MASSSDARVAALVSAAQQQRLRFKGRCAYQESKPYSCFWEPWHSTLDWVAIQNCSPAPQGITKALCRALPLSVDPQALSFPASLPGCRVYMVDDDTFVASDAFNGACAREVRGCGSMGSSDITVPPHLLMYLVANHVPETAHRTFLGMLGQLLHQPNQQNSTLAMRIPTYKDWDARALLWCLVPRHEWSCIDMPQHALPTFRKAERAGKPHVVIDARLWTDSSVSKLLQQLQESGQHQRLHVVWYLPGRPQALGACETSIQLVPFDLTSCWDAQHHVQGFQLFSNDEGDIITSSNRAFLELKGEGGLDSPGAWPSYLLDQRRLLGLNPVTHNPAGHLPWALTRMRRGVSYSPP
jgi:hypothetical protein